MDDDLIMRVDAAVTRLPQTQVSLNEQLMALRVAANRLGLYDAADWLTQQMFKDAAHRV